MFRRIREMLIKEFLQMLRDPRMRGIVFGAPIVQLLIFSFALNTDVNNIKIAVVDNDNTPASRDVLMRLSSSDYFDVAYYLKKDSEVNYLLDRDKVRGALIIHAGFEDDIKSGKTGQIQLIADGTYSNDINVIFGYANRIIRAYSNELKDKMFEKTGKILPPSVTIKTRAWYNPNLESKRYFIPGLVAIMILVVTTLLTSIAIVREKEIGTIEQVMVTPITRLEFILGKTVPYLLIGYIIMTLMFIVINLVFGISIKGSVPLLYILGGVYIIGNLGLALLISVTALTQQQALLTAFMFLLPNVLLSGFMFPIRNMPQIIQYLTYVNPMRWFLTILREIVIKGSGISTLYPAIIMQIVLASIFLILAAVKFRKTMS